MAKDKAKDRAKGDRGKDKAAGGRKDKAAGKGRGKAAGKRKGAGQDGAEAAGRGRGRGRGRGSGGGLGLLDRLTGLVAVLFVLAVAVQGR